MTFRRPLWPWFSAAAILLAVDQVTKALVRAYLPLHDSIPLIGGDFLMLTHVQNPGIAFGFRILGLKPLLIFGWAAAVFLAVYLVRLIRCQDILRWPVMLFLTGAVGNSIDRSIFGQVTDFVDVDFPDFLMQRWPIFNVADSCVTIGIAVLIVLTLFSRQPQRHSHAAEIDAGSNEIPASPSPNHGTGPATSAD